MSHHRLGGWREGHRETARRRADGVLAVVSVQQHDAACSTQHDADQAKGEDDRSASGGGVVQTGPRCSCG